MSNLIAIALIILLVLIISMPAKEYLTPDLNTGSPDSIYIRYKPPENDYTYYTNVDSPGNEIGQATQLGGNITHLKLACNAIPECVGFSSNGTLKNAIAPRENWVHVHKQDLYIKKV